MVGFHRSLCDQPEPPAACVFLSRSGPHVGGEGCDAPGLGRAGGLCLSPFRHDTPQASPESEHLHDPDRSLLASEDLVPGIPVTLPFRRDLLRQPHFHRLHQNLCVLHLTAWRLSSGLRVIKAYLQRWLDNLPSVANCPHARTIRLSGPLTIPGVILMVIPSPGLPFPMFLTSSFSFVGSSSFRPLIFLVISRC